MTETLPPDLIEALRELLYTHLPNMGWFLLHLATYFLGWAHRGFHLVRVENRQIQKEATSRMAQERAELRGRLEAALTRANDADRRARRLAVALEVMQADPASPIPSERLR